MHSDLLAGAPRRTHTHVVREVVAEQADVVRRIFTLAADGVGDRRIAHILQDERVPAPVGTWSKDIVARALANPIYTGVALYGKKGVPAEAWLRRELPELRIVEQALWDRVQARKAKTRTHYLRDEQGHLLSKPESGLRSRYILNGLVRCPSCGGPMHFIGKDGPPRMYCSTRYARPGVCSNGKGVPMVELEESVISVLHMILEERPETVAALMEERDARLRAEEATHVDPRPAALAEAEQVEREIANLVTLAAAGSAGPDILGAIAERRARVEALRATPAPRPPFSMADFWKRFAPVKQVSTLLNRSYPAQCRAALRKLGVDRIRVTPDGAGWTFEGSADLEPYLGPSLLTAAAAVSSEPTGSP